MWHMEAGDRAMTRGEWGIFQLGLGELVAHLEDDLIDETDETQTGVKVFDRLTVEQKIALLADVAGAMHDPDVPMMELTAASEGAVEAVFGVTRALLQEEIAENAETTLRSLLIQVAKEQEFDADDVPRPRSRKVNDWDFILECLESTIFWDMDWAAGDHFLDAPPAEAKAKMEHLGIDPDYFLAIPREPTPKELKASRLKLSTLIADEA